MNGKYEWASIEEVFQWFKDGIFRLDEDDVFKGERKLVPSVNKRNGCQHGDKRVHLFHQRKRRSVNVSTLVWMVGNDRPLPKGFDIHHRNEDHDDNRFQNLFALTGVDHSKLHNGDLVDGTDDEVPF